MSDLPAEVEGWIGQRKYEEFGEFETAVRYEAGEPVSL